MSYEDIAALALAIIVFALCYFTLYRRMDFERRVSTVIAVGFAVITWVFLKGNPAILADTTTRIALILLAAVITLATAIRRSM